MFLKTNKKKRLSEEDFRTIIYEMAWRNYCIERLIGTLITDEESNDWENVYAKLIRKYAKEACEFADKIKIEET